MALVIGRYLMLMLGMLLSMVAIAQSVNSSAIPRGLANAHANWGSDGRKHGWADKQFQTNSGRDVRNITLQSSGQRQRVTPPAKRARTCTQRLVIDVGLGASGGESLREFFRKNGFAILWYNTSMYTYRHSSKKFRDMINEDVAQGKLRLPKLTSLIRKKAKRKNTGNLFVGDLKPSVWISDRAAVIRSLIDAFPNATFVWPLRHPVKWATSKSYWRKQISLCPMYKEWVETNCALYEALARKYGPALLQVPILAVDTLATRSFESSFLASLVRNVGPCFGKKELPHVGHHAPNKVFRANLTAWDPLEHLRRTCPSKPYGCEGLATLVASDDQPSVLSGETAR